MCGIAGVFNIESSRAVDADELERMAATMPHRGPDAQGARVYDGGAGLAHRRLSIIDLSAEANQPFESEDGTLAITYNGEIFNYVELREELERLGRRFRTTSDTEVLLQAYAEWGEEAVQRLNGMWAFAILDRRRDLLFCSRDRFGIKPFAWAHHGGRFLFGSEIKAILAAEPSLATPDFRTLSTVLRSAVGYRVADTCFAGIHRVPPAHNLIVNRTGVEQRRYWDYPVQEEGAPSPEEAAERLRELLVDAIRLRMRSDVPVGSTLSSGIDSSTIVCLLRTFFDGPHETFSASYENESWNEAERARELSESLGMSPNPVPALAGDFLPILRRCVHHLEGPMQNPTVVPLWNIMETAKRKVVVLLEGQGADELLAGYDRACFPAAIRDRVAGGSLRDAGAELGWQLRTQGPLNTLLWGARALLPSGQRLLSAVRGDGRVYAGPLAEHEPESVARLDPAPPAGGHLNELLRHQHEGQLGRLLNYGDAISMAHSLESRLPFMDYRLVEYAFRLPGNLKFRGGLGKALLRDAVRKDVPADILDNRRKLGFRTPIDRWFRESAEETLVPVLLSERCRKRGIFSHPHLERVIARHRAGKVDLSHYLFRWLMTELWFREFID